MSWSVYEESDFTKLVPKKVKRKTEEYMRKYNISRDDAFEEAIKELAKKGSELWMAWYYGDYRRFCPAMYDEKYMDFKKYPIKYKNIS